MKDGDKLVKELKEFYKEVEARNRALLTIPLSPLLCLLV